MLLKLITSTSWWPDLVDRFRVPVTGWMLALALVVCLLLAVFFFFHLTIGLIGAVRERFREARTRQQPTVVDPAVTEALRTYYPRSFSAPASKGGDWRHLADVHEEKRRRQLAAIVQTPRSRS